MKLDSEEQRTLISKLLEVVPIQGAYQEIRPLITQLDTLKDAISKATIEESK